jgi:AhpD family alkylhydroperoxidase
MRPWIKYAKVAPDGIRTVNGLDNYVKQCGLEEPLLEVVRIRASQINGCAFCIDAHTKDARSEGESEQRIYCLSAWRETPFYSDRERAALAWTEAVTKISENQVPDDVYENAQAHFSEKELVDLTLAVIAINSWNRLAMCFNSPPGIYHPESPVTVRKTPEPMGV